MFALCDKKQTTQEFAAQGQGARGNLRQAVRPQRRAASWRRSATLGDDRIQSNEPASAACRLALTLGEPAGIGPDLTLALWRRRDALALPPFYLIGDADFLAPRARRLGLDVPLAAVAPADAAAAFARALPVVPLDLAVTAAPGKPDATQRAGGDRLDPPRGRRRAGRPRRRGGHQSGRQERALPRRLRRARPHRIPGAAGRGGDRRKRAMPVMMLWSPELAVVPVTIHLPLRRGAGASDPRADRRRPGASWRAICSGASASPSRGWRWRA